MLHEEVVVDWSSLQAQVNDGKLLENVQMDFVIGVNIYFSYPNSKMILAFHRANLYSISQIHLRQKLFLTDH